eukprot:6323783-Alexandrium_andersonii.AAC.1
MRRTDNNRNMHPQGDSACPEGLCEAAWRGHSPPTACCPGHMTVCKCHPTESCMNPKAGVPASGPQWQHVEGAKGRSGP